MNVFSVTALLIEVSVLITIGWATTMVWWSRRWRQQRIAWQWWHKQQALQRHHNAESIRDGLLQQTFAFRRYLETAMAQKQRASADFDKPDQTAQWLERFQTFYQSLERLSNDLSPPFVTDSLPLALQFALNDWQKSHPEPAATLRLPKQQAERACQGSPKKNQLILSVVMELLSVLTDNTDAIEHLQLTLTEEATAHTLIVTVEGSDAQHLQGVGQRPEIQHLKEIFHSLAAGQLEISSRETSLTVQLCWHDT